MRAARLWSSVVLSVLVACGAPARGGAGDDDPGTDAGSGSGSGNQDGCSDAAKLIYVVDSNNRMSTWDGATKTFRDIGNLSCPVQTDPIFGTPATPFSMSVDRNAAAWVLFSSSEVMKVDTSTAALTCTDANYTVQQQEVLFGMGFSTDAVGGSSDTLYIAGGPDAGNAASTTLASLNTQTMQVTRIGTVTGNPELTGTGSAELWGFFPATSGAAIKKINKTSGAAEQTFTLPALAGQPTAWAFAFWGGDFWVFLQKDNETSTTVYQFDAANGTLKGMTPAPGRSIVGAGVSTCAPVVIL